MSRRFGLILPSVNTVLEPEISDARPADVTFHFARARLRTGSDRRALDALRADAPRAARELSDARPDMIAFACTSASMLADEGLGELERQMADASGIAVTTTATAVADALRSLGARRVGVGTPYRPWVGAAEAGFLERRGVEVLTTANLGIVDGHEMAALDRAAVAELARSVNRPTADALFLSCTDLPTFESLSALESELGKPVVSSNSATLWKLVGPHPRLRHLGRLFGDEVRR